MPMKKELFEEIKSFVKQESGLSKDCADKVISLFPEVNPETLRSILHYYWRFKGAKVRLGTLKKQIEDDYEKAIKNREPIGIIVRIAKKYDLPPTNVARVTLEDYIIKHEEQDEQLLKNKVSKFMKDTTLIKDMDLAYEIFLAVLNDEQFGTTADAIKHSVGFEYELKLATVARRNGLLFKDEAFLRMDGYDKTPDIKLDVPVAVNGFIICWIESKAIFGHPKLHEQYMKDQYISYWNRFGPGLIIYWLGFVETILNTTEKRFIISDVFPDNLVLMKPKSIEPSLKM